MYPGLGRLLLGLLLAAVGGGITLASYASASDGGTYVVWWGLIAFGGWMALGGVVEMARFQSWNRQSSWQPEQSWADNRIGSSWDGED